MNRARHLRLLPCALYSLKFLRYDFVIVFFLQGGKFFITDNSVFHLHTPLAVVPCLANNAIPISACLAKIVFSLNSPVHPSSMPWVNMMWKSCILSMTHVHRGHT